MNATLVALLVTLGAGTWVYLKFQKYSGRNTNQSAMAAGAVSIVVFVIVLFIMQKILG